MGDTIHPLPIGMYAGACLGAPGVVCEPRRVIPGIVFYCHLSSPHRPFPASECFIAFLAHSLRVISWKLMAAGLTQSICSSKLGCVQKSINRARLLLLGLGPKAETPAHMNQVQVSFWNPGLEGRGVSFVCYGV